MEVRSRVWSWQDVDLNVCDRSAFVQQKNIRAIRLHQRYLTDEYIPYGEH